MGGENGKKKVSWNPLDYIFTSSTEPSDHPSDSRVTGKEDEPRSDASLRTEEPEKQQELVQTTKMMAGEKHSLKARIFGLESDLAKYKERCAKLQAERQSLRQGNDKLIQDLNAEKIEQEFVSSRYNYVIQKCLKPYANHLGTKYNDNHAETIEAILMPLLKDALESSSLRNQVQSLQQEMLAKVEKVQAITDDQFAQDFRSLASSVKALSRMTQFSNEVDIFQLLGGLVINDFLPPDRYVYCKKKSFIEVCIWSILLSMVFGRPFAMFGIASETVNNLWSRLFDPEGQHSWPYPTSVCEAWRYNTMEGLIELVGRDIIATGDLKKSTKHYDGSLGHAVSSAVIHAREQVAKCILAGLETVSPEVDIEVIHQIIDKAFTLALHMSLQRSRIRVTYPCIGTEFSKQEMSCLPDADGNDFEKGAVEFTINPGLTKWGDALGKKLDLRYDIVPSLVQLKPAVSASNAGVSLI